jgi:2-iminobutanoate/2-iminopropanoate deaminase
MPPSNVITRTNPDVGYLEQDVFEAYAFTQSVRVGNQLYLSGIAPLRGPMDRVSLVGLGDLRAQVRFCLEVLQRCLAAEGTGLERWVSQVAYFTDMGEAHKTADIFREVFGRYPMASTWVEVKGLFVPGQMVEITGMAILD